MSIHKRKPNQPNINLQHPFFLSILSSADSPKARIRVPLAARKQSSPDVASPYHLSNGIANRITASNTFTPVIVKSSHQPMDHQPDAFVDAKQLKNDFNLGRLDGLVSSPNRSSKVRVTDSKKITAILLETNIVELQRHLLTITVQNQVGAIIISYEYTYLYAYSIRL